LADEIDRVFHALSDRTRRTILVVVSTERKRVTDVASNFEMSLPGVSKHIRVLEAAGLISRTVEGRVHYLSAIPGALSAASSQVALLQGLWSDTLEKLDETITGTEDQ